LLGHARIDMTQIYTSIRPPQLKRVVSFYEAQATRMLVDNNETRTIVVLCGEEWRKGPNSRRRRGWRNSAKPPARIRHPIADERCRSVKL